MPNRGFSLKADGGRHLLSNVAIQLARTASEALAEFVLVDAAMPGGQAWLDRVRFVGDGQQAQGLTVDGGAQVYVQGVATSSAMKLDFHRTQLLAQYCWWIAPPILTIGRACHCASIEYKCCQGHCACCPVRKFSSTALPVGCRCSSDDVAAKSAAL